MRNLPEQSAEKLDKVRVKLDTKMRLIIREQDQVIEASNKGIKGLNSDLKALRHRLKPEGPYDEKYYSLKDRYENKLAERAVLENARTMAEESITAAKLHVIPGEIDRSEW